MEIKSRHHLRADAVDEISQVLADDLGIEVPDATFELVEFDDFEFDIVLVDGSPNIFYVDEGEAFLTVKGANAYEPSSHVVTVDAGAVSFVSDGADIMRPGIVEADTEIGPEDLVAIKEETHGKFLAIGRARVAGDDMLGDSGKVIDSIHHVSDELYEWTL